MNRNEVFARRFRQCRDATGLSQQEVADNILVSRGSVAGYESLTDTVIPREPVLRKAADLFRVSVDYLLGRTDDPTPVEEQPDDLDVLALLQRYRDVLNKGGTVPYGKNKQLTLKQINQIQRLIEGYVLDSEEDS